MTFEKALFLWMTLEDERILSCRGIPAKHITREVNNLVFMRHKFKYSSNDDKGHKFRFFDGKCAV